jgi:CheY-like chemotaxis protein/HPt (histidine-containing phosphotransfer) domain-containing protein
MRPSLSILVAEDNPVNRRVILLLLERLGYGADVVATGSAALSALSEQRYDLVLMDAQMPEMDGLEAARRIVAGAATGGHRPRIVAMIASTERADRDACLAAGMDDCLGKPILLDDLQRALLRAAGSRAEPLFDPACIDRLRQLEAATGQAIVAEVVGHFLESAPGQVEAIREALASGDAGALGFAAHALKGSSAQLGACRLAALAEELEALARNGAVPEEMTAGTPGIVAELAAELDRLAPLLAAWQ